MYVFEASDTANKPARPGEHVIHCGHNDNVFNAILLSTSSTG